MDVSLSGLGSSMAEDDYEGRGHSPSLAPFLARLSRDERLGWTTSRSPADDTDSLNVNVSDCGSCHLSEVSSVSSWLNDASAVDDDYSSCAPDDESGSEKDDIDEDEDDNGPEVQPLFLLQHCLEEKLLEQQQNSDVVYAGIADCVISTNLSDHSSVQNDQSEVETNTIKRVSRNLFSFKSSETASDCMAIKGHSASDTDGVISAFSHQSMPLRRSSSRCNPDSLICAGAIYDFNSSLDKGDIKPVNSELFNINTYDTVKDGQHGLHVKPQQTMHKCDFSSRGTNILPSETFVKNTSPVKDVVENVVETPLCFPTVSKTNFADNRSAVDNKLDDQDSEQNRSAVDTQQTNIANGSVFRKQINHSPYSSCNTTAVTNDIKKTLDVTSLKANHGSWQNKSLMDFQCHSLSSVKSKQQEILQSGASTDKSMTVEDTKMKKSGEASADNIDAASVVSDEAEKVSDHACSLAMPAVEDGLSNSDISDVDEAFSMFAGLKPPDPVPVDTSFGTRSPVTSYANNNARKDPDNTADVHSNSTL